MLAFLFGLSILLTAVLVIRPSQTSKALAFTSLFVLPLTVSYMGVETHIENSKQTTFCTSCHVMGKHGRSLLVDDTTILAASHYQGGRVPRDRACFTCYTTYTMYGDMQAKLRGVKHVLVNYFGKVPDKLKLYEPYHNRECLHCHQGARRYLKGETHTAEPDRMEKMRLNQLSCVSKDCHDTVHLASEVDSLPLWKPEGIK